MSIVNDPKFAEFLGFIEAGVSVEDAAMAADLSAGAVISSLEAGRLEEERLSFGGRARKVSAPDLQVWKEYGKARAQGRAKALALINRASADDWKAAKFRLEYMQSTALRSGREDPAYYMGGE
jgi:hypothetical protein